MGDGSKRLRKTVVLDEADAQALLDVAHAMRLASQSEALRRLIRHAARGMLPRKEA